MADRFDIVCPCCGDRLTVDAETGEILAEERPKVDTEKSFEKAMGEIKSGARKREDAFSKAFDRTQKLDDLLGKKFEEAKKKAEKDKTKKPLRPFDYD
jgi:hypothetical protein